MQPSAFNLPAPSGRNHLIFKNGYNNNIVTVLNSQFPAAVKQCENVYFSGGNIKEKARAIYHYLRNNVNYRKDPPGKQLIQLPSRMIRGTKIGDCKSLSLSAAAFLYCNGAKNVRLRYASYHPTDNTPTHVYAVAQDETGKQIIVDPVYKQFNQEAKYTFKTDYPMQISVLSGPPALVAQKMTSLEQIREKVRPGGFYYTVITNKMLRKQGKSALMNYQPTQLRKYAAMIMAESRRTKSPLMRKLLQEEYQSIQNNNFQGLIYSPRSGQAIRGIEDEIGKLKLKKLAKGLKKIKLKNLVKGVKAVGLVAPRKAFLTLVRLNVRGLAKRLSLLSESELKKIWVDRFAGKLSVLQNAINKGKKKRPLFGASKKVKAIKGIGVIVDESNSIGTLGGMEIAAIIAAAAPVLVVFTKALKGKGIPETPENAAAPNETGDFQEAESSAADAKPGLLSWINKAVDVAKETGIIPDRPETVNEAKVSQEIPGDDLQADPTGPSTGGSQFKISPVILIGGAAAAFLLMRKK